MRKSKREPLGLDDWRKLLEVKFPPKNPAWEPEVLKSLEKAVGRQLSQMKKQQTMARIDSAVDEYLKSEAWEHATLTESELRARVASHVLLMKKLLDRLERATAWELIMLSGGSKDLDDFVDYLKRWIALWAEREHLRKTDPLDRPHFDRKLYLLVSCRRIIRLFSRRLPGLTKDGPLTTFASSVLKYGTGLQGGFNRQLRQIPAYEKFSRKYSAQLKADMKAQMKAQLKRKTALNVNG